jgi:hypothetical protein
VGRRFTPFNGRFFVGSDGRTIPWRFVNMTFTSVGRGLASIATFGWCSAVRPL